MILDEEMFKLADELDRDAAELEADVARGNVFNEVMSAQYMRSAKQAHKAAMQLRARIMGVYFANGTIKTRYVYPWTGVTPGRYITSNVENAPIEVEILDGQGDFAGQLMYRWFADRIPARLMHEMPKTAVLIPCKPAGVPC